MINGGSVTLGGSAPAAILVIRRDGEDFVTLHHDGRLEYHGEPQPEAAARAFWEALSTFSPVAQYIEAKAGHDQLVRELDVLLNGTEGAAQQASLCDIVAQVRSCVRARGSKYLFSAPEPASQGEAVVRGTFECPVCGYDKPHHHDEDDRFPWHMQYREKFERIVHRHIRQIGREWLIGGMRLNGRNMWLGRVGPDARVETGWAELERSGNYKNDWLQTLWRIFKETVQLTAPPAQPAERVPEGWVLVPREPTEAMVAASMIRVELPRKGTLSVLGARAWEAMLAASPAPSEGGKGVDRG